MHLASIGHPIVGDSTYSYTAAASFICMPVCIGTPVISPPPGGDIAGVTSVDLEWAPKLAENTAQGLEHRSDDAQAPRLMLHALSLSLPLPPRYGGTRTWVYTLHPKPLTLNPEPQTLNPEH